MNGTGVVIVTYNSGEVINACLDSCDYLPTVVVDNASEDDTLQQVRSRPHVSVIANSRNRGFAAAVNQGVQSLDADFTLLLNPDVELQSGVRTLEETCSAPGVGIAGGKLSSKNGVLQAGFMARSFPTALTLIFEVLGINRIFPANPVNRHYRLRDFDPAQPAAIDQPPGAFLMFRREAWERVSGFDAGFEPLWFEDVDFCKRVREAGFEIRYVPEALARHRGGHSVSKLNWSCREVYWYGSLLRYASKHFRPSANRGVRAAVVLGSVFRAVAGTIRQRSFKPIAVYARVARMALAGAAGSRLRTKATALR
jgi:N-acetylglucosaminyl-diphospho-decaprenol L-rhamnosyltransferase